MAINRPAGTTWASAAEAQLARVADQGCARHPHIHALITGSGPSLGRDLADAVHLLCSLHGRHPALVELAFTCSAEEAARPWLENAAEAFELERLFLVKLTSTVGPLPSTPGAVETETSLLAQRHALEILARSERRGCALGAATALIGDWRTIRPILDRVASRAGLDLPQSRLPSDGSIAEVILAASTSAGSERALAFGGEQLLLQHRGLFDLLEARASARADA
jgi:hypothetical protein